MLGSSWCLLTLTEGCASVVPSTMYIIVSTSSLTSHCVLTLTEGCSSLGHRFHHSLQIAADFY